MPHLTPMSEMPDRPEHSLCYPCLCNLLCSGDSESPIVSQFLELVTPFRIALYTCSLYLCDWLRTFYIQLISFLELATHFLFTHLPGSKQELINSSIENRSFLLKKTRHAIKSFLQQLESLSLSPYIFLSFLSLSFPFLSSSFPLSHPLFSLSYSSLPTGELGSH